MWHLFSVILYMQKFHGADWLHRRNLKLNVCMHVYYQQAIKFFWVQSTGKFFKDNKIALALQARAIFSVFEKCTCAHFLQIALETI